MNNFSEGVFARLATMKQEKISAGTEVIYLSIGAPNIPPPAHVMQVLAQEALKPENYVYAITDTRELLNEASDWYHDVTARKLTLPRKFVRCGVRRKGYHILR